MTDAALDTSEDFTASSSAVSRAASIGLARLPPAFQLALACAAWPPSAARDERVRAAAQGVDWEAFLRVVARQRIPGLAHAALVAAEVTPPEAAQTALRRQAQANSARSLALGQEAQRLQSLLDAAGIGVLTIKGAALGQLAYGSQGLKHGRDIDLLVQPADAERAYQALTAEGYRNVIPAGALTAAKRQVVFRLHKDIELHHAGRRVNLELHWRLIDNPALLRQVTAACPSQTVEAPGGSLRTLNDPDLFAYLCVHGASHAWFRLKWLADLNAWLSGKRDEDLVALFDHAERLGVGRCAAQALALCRDLLGLALPAALAARFGGIAHRWMLAAAFDAMVGPDGETELAKRPFGPFRLLPSQFLRSRGAAFHLGQAGLMVNSLDDHLALPLPPALGFLYPLLRFPMWLARVARRRFARGRG